jgi:undecaprenyl-diphosphatase
MFDLRREHNPAAVSAGWSVSIILGLVLVPVLVRVEPVLTRVELPLGSFVAAMAWATWLGYGGFDIGIFVALGLAGWYSGQRTLMWRGCVAAFAVSGAGLLGQLVKNLACRARPTAPLAGTFFVGFPCFPAKYAYSSFPSGHAATAFAAAVFLALWYPSGRWVFLGLATIVAISRIVLGAHFPSDVLGGAVIGAGSALVVYSFVPAARRAGA